MWKIYDISMTIQPNMPVFNRNEAGQPVIRNVANHGETDGVYESRLDLNLHTGTHVDAPLHMVKDGATIEKIGLEELVGTARVVDLTHCQAFITKEDLEQLGLQRNEWVLFKTRNSYSDEFEFDFVYLREDGTRYLVDIGVRGIGTDALGIERAQKEYPTHRTLFRNSIIIVEGLRLADVTPGTYLMVIAPLKLAGVEAAPARALLLGST
ncbi:arylformamidase [Paenibacillus phyllosphaerae]|uniref:Kynurenine formamidase n=1 Tax=Paenibacillus phyllosphaerae TaxID=274593 RepID=A0A7W5B5T6_9BACL|nr:cyclase family protein [Paenibacillus phyllosphaerae]MBB3114714.1 arylformamidase [Paenibacillus phyllosphaerae]